MVQYQLAVSIELAPLAIVIAGDHIHLFTPLSWGNEMGFSLSASKANAKPDCSDGGATLFLAGADHGYCEKEKRTRQNNLQSTTVSLQVVIGLCVDAKKRRL